MTPERRQEIEKLYHSALKLGADQRAAFLKQACVDDETLGQEVESLLSRQTEADNFIESLFLEVAGQMTSETRTQTLVGRQIGSYTVLSLLGAGGMGEVYLAQDSGWAGRSRSSCFRLSLPKTKREYTAWSGRHEPLRL